MGTPFELDHLFVCTRAGAPEAAGLLQLGLVEGERNAHRGQGTSNRRFFFRNAMLELLWVDDERAARSEATRRTRLYERWRQRGEGACPFGFCFRPAAPGGTVPFPGWAYQPEYLPAPLAIHVAGNSDVLAEPMLFYLPFATRPDRAEGARRQPLDHPIGFREITRVTWVRPAAGSTSDELLAASHLDCFTIREGHTPQLEIGFDGEVAGERRDLQPDLPVMLCW